jgi:hypothetical protein
VLFNLGLGSVQAGVAATLFPLISLTTAAGGMVWFSERLSLWQLAGGVLILGAAGAVAVSLGARETASPTRGAGKMDANDDLKVLSRDQLIEEVKRLRAGVRKHRDNSDMICAGITPKHRINCMRHRPVFPPSSAFGTLLKIKGMLRSMAADFMPMNSDSNGSATTSMPTPITPFRRPATTGAALFLCSRSRAASSDGPESPSSGERLGR